MLKRISLLIFILFLIIASTNSSETISIQAGVNIFNDPRGGTYSYIEFPFSLKRYQFELVPMEGDYWFRGSISARLVLSDTLGNKIDSASTMFYTRVNNMQEAARKDVELFNKLTLSLEPGSYDAVLIVNDVNNGKTSSFLYERFEIKAIVSDYLAMSDIELANSVNLIDPAQKSVNPRFIKNGYDIIPSPMGIFNDIDNYIYLYAELYNLQFSPTTNDSFALTYQIYKNSGEIYFDFGEMNYRKQGTTAVITNKLDYSSWALGKYELRITAVDLGSEEKVVSSRDISIVSMPIQQPAKIIRTIYSPLDTASLVTKSNWIRFLISSTDWEMFQTLNDTGKYAYIDRFFADRDPSLGSKNNEYLLDVISRFNYCNATYSSLAGVTNGWKTDRGRILLRYGLSDEIKTASPPAVTKPIQVWYYYALEGGVTFVFEDSRGYGNYKLVHSTAKDETYSGGWEEAITNYDMDFD